MTPETKAWLARVDWLRVVNRLSTFARTLRSDAELQADHATEQKRADRLLHSLDGAARQLLNCKAPQPCACPLCEGESR